MDARDVCEKPKANVLSRSHKWCCLKKSVAQVGMSLALMMQNTSTYETQGVSKAIRFQTVLAAFELHMAVMLRCQPLESNQKLLDLWSQS